MTDSAILQKYQEQYVNTLTPGELLVLLYNEALKNINKAIFFINNKKIMEAHNCIIKAETIFLSLMGDLDFNYPVSKNLLTLYEYLYNSLVNANMEKNTETLTAVLNMTTELRDAWQQAEKICRTGSPKPLERSI
ncbi:MAG: flagellar export chaperone FliS [Clostridiales bacterium 43-6]|nr:MAG: flagellar export chaperone FliS [Clostridiales bacterium 43-6]